MKATDLMIGDWVKISHLNKIGKVYRIDRANDKGNGYAAVIDGDYHESNLEPISLTPEILEKIGFNLLPQNTKIDSYHLSYPNTIHPKFGINVNMFTVPEMIIFNDNRRLVYLEVKYVHELQHALRLCGIEKEIIL